MPTPPTNSGSLLRDLLDGERVFSSNPQVSHYYPSAAIEDARRRLQRAIDRGDGPALVVGAAGTGKSLLLQALAAQYHKRFDVVLLACARICTRRALLQTILFELGLPYRLRDEGQLRLGLLDHLLSEKQSPTGLLLLVDEGQSLSIALLDELRIMTNLLRGGSPRVRLVLAGSSALEESFAHPDLESFSQRLSARCYLSPWSREETCQFVRAQVAATGTPPENVFTVDAYDAIFEATDGVPRLVNQVCDRALLFACDNDRTLLDRQIIQAAWADLQQLPTTWTVPRGSTVSLAQHSQVIEFGSLSDTPNVAIEPEIVDPTELDADDDEDIELESPAELSPPSHMNAVRATDGSSRRSPRTAHDPANPFGEEFDEEEVVLDNFAAWDDMFHPRTPRVENYRDCSLATLVQSSLDATPTSDLQPNQTSLHDDNADEEDKESAEVDSAEDPLPPDESPTNWPRLRLADVPESVAPEASTEPDATAFAPARRGWNDSTSGRDNPVLIIEDDSPTPNHPGPPVRRLAYQHLFSRLRSG